MAVVELIVVLTLAGVVLIVGIGIGMLVAPLVSRLAADADPDEEPGDGD